MGVRVIQGFKDGDEDDRCAVLYCSTTGTAFGPLFKDFDAAEDFLSFIGVDPRAYSANVLRDEFDKWQEARRVSP